MILSLIAAALIGSAAQSNAYQLEITVVDGGVEQLASRSQVVIDEPNDMIITDGQSRVALHSNLYTAQGDGDFAILRFEGSVERDGESVVTPSFNVVRGQPFYYQSGQPNGHMVRITLTPLPASE